MDPCNTKCLGIDTTPDTGALDGEVLASNGDLQVFRAGKYRLMARAESLNDTAWALEQRAAGLRTQSSYLVGQANEDMPISPDQPVGVGAGQYPAFR